MGFILRSVRIIYNRQVVEGAGFNGKHILLQFHFQAVFIYPRGFITGAVAREQIDPFIIVYENSGVKLTDFTGARSQNIPIGITDKIQESKGTCGGIGYGDTNLF